MDNSWQQTLFMADTVPPATPTRHPSRWCVTAAIDPFPAEKNVRPPHKPKRATPATRNSRPPWQGETEEHHAMTKEIVPAQAAQRDGTATRTGPRITANQGRRGYKVSRQQADSERPHRSHDAYQHPKRTHNILNFFIRK